MNKFEIRNPKHETISKFEFPNVQNSFGHSNFGHLDLFRLPARSRSGEGRNFDIRISDLIGLPK
jgi:hypothetical protein